MSSAAFRTVGGPSFALFRPDAPMLQVFLAAHGTKLSRSCWTHLVTRTRPYERLSSEQEPRTGVAPIFGIGPSYLLERTSPIPDYSTSGG